MKYLRILAVSLFICFLHDVNAQNDDAPEEKDQEGVAIVTQDPSESPLAAQNRGIEDAQVDAIEKAFPYLIDDETITTIKDGNVDYVMKSHKKVRGMWIKHNRKPECVPRMVTSRGQQVNQYTCTVYGLIREVKNAPQQFVALPLGPLKKQQENFDKGERFYLSFESSIGGYISVFMRDMKSVQRILPYPRMNTPKYNRGLPVTANEKYLFFDRGHRSVDLLKVQPQLVQPFEVWTDLTEGVEENTVYVLFSENPIPLPFMDRAFSEGSFTYPASMDAIEFEKWLEDRRLSDLSHQELSYRILIDAE